MWDDLRFGVGKLGYSSIHGIFKARYSLYIQLLFLRERL